jgi:hypothetical protein
MVAYSFDPRFEVPIVMGTKRQTIRATGKRRHASAGDTLQLYQGMRTRRCRLLATAVCVSNEPIKISFEHFVVQIGSRAGSEFTRLIGIDEAGIAALLDPFARDDGFGNFDEMRAFWLLRHGAGDFEGRLITWSPASVRAAP